MPQHAASSLCEIFTTCIGRLDIFLLSRHSGIKDKTDLVHAALGVTAFALAMGRRGYDTRVLHEGGLSTPVDAIKVEMDFSANYAYFPRNTRLGMFVRPEFQRALENVKTYLHTTSDNKAVTFALAFSKACVAKIEECGPVSSARLFLTKGDTPDSPGVLLAQQPFDIRDGKPVTGANATTRKIRGRVHQRPKAA